MMWRTASCCGGSGVTQVDIYGNGMSVGLVGVRQAFQELYAAGVAPDEHVGDDLLARIKAVNYVPRTSEPQYKAALLREYAAFCQRQSA